MAYYQSEKDLRCDLRNVPLVSVLLILVLHSLPMILALSHLITWLFCTAWTTIADLDSSPRGGGFSHWHGIRICACLLGHLFAKFGIAIGGFSSETKEPKLHKLGVFWANYCKKHPIWSKLGAFLPKMVYWWVGNLAKNWYRDSQIFEVRQAHPRTILVKEPPPPGIVHSAIVF